jgi:hypothetical protein
MTILTSLWATMFICHLLNFTLKLEFIDKIFWTLQLYIVLNSEGPIYSLCIAYSFWVGLKDDIIDASASHLLHSFHQSQSFPFNYDAPSLDPWCSGHDKFARVITTHQPTLVFPSALWNYTPTLHLYQPIGGFCHYSLSCCCCTCMLLLLFFR